MPDHTASRAKTCPKPTATADLDIDLLVAAHYGYIRRLAVSILDDLNEAEDAAQDTFIAASRSLSTFRADADPKTWLTAIAVNTCRARLRKRKVRQTLQSALEALHLAGAGSSSPEHDAIQRESDSQIWQAVDSLDEKHRLVVLLRYVHELPAGQIARALGISEGTVHSRLHYARQKLQARLGGQEPHAEVSDGTR
jgi:RNA polymerase sigma-70 factor (ECF subfamily)